MLQTITQSRPRYLKKPDGKHEHSLCWQERIGQDETIKQRDMGLEQLRVKFCVNLCLFSPVRLSRRDWSIPRVVCDDSSMTASWACERYIVPRSCLISHASVATFLPLASVRFEQALGESGKMVPMDYAHSQ